ncbi:MAG: hypothetical protein H6883_14880 [Rhodobiaceae bacterium]|nr:hypothetical protein [Rhodobiaceae bacterium]MCC0057404.1 hypothetical protein [Rhodobiaceae bacterium]
MIDMELDELLGFDQVSKVSEGGVAQAGRLLSKLAGEVPTIKDRDGQPELEPANLLGFDQIEKASGTGVANLKVAGRLLSKMGPEIPDEPALDTDQLPGFDQ